MKRISTLALVLSLLFGLVPATPASAAYVGEWFWQNPLPAGIGLVRADFAGDTGWAVGTSGNVLRTISGGAEWAKQYGVPGAGSINFVDVDAVDSSTAWIVGRSGHVFCTRDAGETWANKAPVGVGIPSAVRFLNASEGWLGNEAGDLWRSEDGGETWQYVKNVGEAISRFVTNGSSLFVVAGGSIHRGAVGSAELQHVGGAQDPITDLSFGDANHAVGVTFMGGTIRTSNGGASWAKGPLINAAIDGGAVHNVGALTAYLYTRTDWIYKTTDGGITWQHYYPRFINRSGVTVSPRIYVYDVVAGAGRLFAFSQGGSIMYSTDKGTTWRYVTGDFFERLIDVSFESTRTGLVIGEKSIHYTTDGGANWYPRTAPSGATFSAISIGSNNRGWLVGTKRLSSSPYYSGVVYRTNDGGRTFAAQTTPASLEMLDVWTNDGMTGWASGNSGKIFKTTDGGATWKQCSISWTGYTFEYPDEHRPIGNIVVGPNGLGYAKVTNLDLVLETTNGGTSWHVAPFRANGDIALRGNTVAVGTWEGVVRVGTYPDFNWSLGTLPGTSEAPGAIEFVNDSVVYATANDLLYRSEDGGATWQAKWKGTRLESIATAGDVDAWAVGYSGAIVYNGGVNGDFVPPLTRTSAPSGWNDADTYVSLDGSDKTGVDGTWWAYGEPTPEPSEPSSASAGSRNLGIAAAVTSGSLTYLPYRGRIKVTAEGVTPVTFYSRDVNGNFESPRTVRIRIDRKGPSVRSDAKSVYGASATVKVNATDAGIGVRKMCYTIDGSSTKTVYGSSFTVKRGLGSHTLTYWAYDKLGHRSAKVTKKYVVRPYASLTAPSTVSTATVGVTFSATGFLSPKHSSTGKVVVKSYRNVDGGWVAGPTASVYVTPWGTRSRYSAKLALPSAGLWKIIATHADSGHYYSVSTARYLQCVEP